MVRGGCFFKVMFALFCFPELTIRGGHCSPYTYPQAIRMIEREQIPLEVGWMGSAYTFTSINTVDREIFASGSFHVLNFCAFYFLHLTKWKK